MPAGYIYRADYAIGLQPFMPGLGRRAPRVGVRHHSRVPGQFLSLHHPLHYERAWVSIPAGGSGGRQPGCKVAWHTLAHTTAYLNRIIKAPGRGQTERRAGLPAGRKELIKRELMLPAPSRVGSVFRAPVIEKYLRGRMGVR